MLKIIMITVNQADLERLLNKTNSKGENLMSDMSFMYIAFFLTIGSFL